MPLHTVAGIGALRRPATGIGDVGCGSGNSEIVSPEVVQLTVGQRPPKMKWHYGIALPVRAFRTVCRFDGRWTVRDSPLLISTLIGERDGSTIS